VYTLILEGHSACVYWLTYKQAQQLEGQVKKGEKSSLVVFWKRLSMEDKETNEKRSSQ